MQNSVKYVHVILHDLVVDKISKKYTGTTDNIDGTRGIKWQNHNWPLST